MIIKTPWQEVAVGVEEVYGIFLKISQDDEDSFFICPYCDEPIYKNDYPEIESEVDETTMCANFPMCPICEEKYEIEIE